MERKIRKPYLKLQYIFPLGSGIPALLVLWYAGPQLSLKDSELNPVIPTVPCIATESNELAVVFKQKKIKFNYGSEYVFMSPLHTRKEARTLLPPSKLMMK